VTILAKVWSLDDQYAAKSGGGAAHVSSNQQAGPEGAFKVASAIGVAGVDWGCWRRLKAVEVGGQLDGS
jgi:hypothetical protein